MLLPFGLSAGIRLVSSDSTVATAKPSRTRRQPSAKPITPAKARQQRQQVAQEHTRQMADAAYLRMYRKITVAMARQKAREDALRDAGSKGTVKKPAKPTRQRKR